MTTKNTADLQTDNAAAITTNSAKENTGARVRVFIADVLDSFWNKLDNPFANASQAATGTATDLFLPPAYAVPKDSTTGAARLPSGTEAQRPSTPAAGMLRFNSETPGFEGHNGSTWGAIGGAGGGSSHHFDFAYFDSANRSPDWTQLATWTHSVDVGVVDFTSLSGAYKDLLIVCDGMGFTTPGVGTSGLAVSASVNNGSNWTSFGTLINSLNGATGVKGNLIIYGYAQAAAGMLVGQAGSAVVSGSNVDGYSQSQYLKAPSTDQTAVDAIRVSANDGEFTAGTITVYGI